MIDHVPPTYIEYKSLSSSTSVAESQKDIISLALKHIHENWALVETNHLSNNEYWQVKCLRCPTSLTETMELDLNSVVVDEVSGTDSPTLSFQTLTNHRNSNVWKISLKHVYPVVIHKNDLVKVILQKNDGLTIQSTGQALQEGSIGKVIPVKVRSFFSKSSYPSQTTIESKVMGPGEVSYVYR